MEQDVTGAASTPNEAPSMVSAVESAVASRDQAAFKEARRAERAGKPLEPTKATASAAVTPDTPAASTDALPTPASEPGKPKDKGVSARNRELDDEIQGLQERLRVRKALREELAQQPKGEPSAVTPAAPATPTKRDTNRFKALPGFPKSEDYDDFEEFVTAQADFIAEQRLNDFRQESQQQEQVGEFKRTTAAMLSKGRESFDDFDAVLGAADAAGMEFPPHVVRRVLSQERGHEIAYALAKQAGNRALWERIADPVEFGLFVGETLSSSKADAPSSVPSFTQAPAPPRVLGGKPADAADPIASAVARHDVAAFRAERARERQAALR